MATHQRGPDPTDEHLLSNTRDESLRSGVGWISAAVGLTLFGLQLGCTSSMQQEAKAGAGEVTQRDTTVVHEDCDINAAGAEKLDANADGRADITIVKSGGREVCRAVDLNFDGNIDSWVYLDEGGKVRRREFAYGRDNRIVEIRVYSGGQLAQMQRVTTLAGRLDTWHFYQSGRLARTERDSDGDGVIDQWWEYPEAAKPNCPLIHADMDGDGRPDPGGTVDVCKETGYVPPERSKHYKYRSPDFSRPGALPTENDVGYESSGGGGEKKSGGGAPDKGEQTESDK